MKDNAIEPKLMALERAAARTPVDDLVLVEGYSRLSLFEKAAEAASRLSAAYPGDERMARQALQIHRSLAGLDLSHEAPAKAVVDRVAPALIDPNPFITELGELYEETGRPEMALNVWKALLDRDPRQEERIKETATLLWDYGHMKEALDTIETGRTRLQRPRMLAFEAGVLREAVKDLDGAIREYLDAVRPDAETDDCYCSGFENDQRSLRRLAQWMGRDRALTRVLDMIDALKPGREADEKTLLAFWPLGSISTPTPGLDWDADDWIDAMDQPADPVGREEREARRLAARGREHAGIARVAKALVARATAMTPAATSGRFLSALESSAAASEASAWATTEARDRFFTSIVARQAELAPTLEERLRLEIDLAQRLAGAGRVPEADALWNSLGARIEALPESASKIQALVSRAAFVERNGGFEKARASWDGLIAKYPWSLGVIEDRIAFLRRHGHAEEARQALEEATARAAPGHLVPLLTRLISESLGEKDLPRASRALDRLLQTAALKDDERLGALSLQARLRFQQDPSFAAVAFATAEAPRFKPELRAQVFAEVARAAAVEKAYATSVSVWIEALNRSTQRDWIKEASRAARRTGKPEVLVSFFEKQQRRSPRDVRWAVATRELRVATDDLPGGIEMARTAASIRPERPQLWDEAVELMERDSRFLEAADFLEGWSVQRPDDPAVAGRRSELYIRAGDLKKAVAVESAALAAFAKTDHTDEDLASRTADAARRLWRQGQPQLAWRFLAPRGTAEEIEASGLSAQEQFQLALLNQSFMPLLSVRLDDADRVGYAADVLGQYGRIDQREQVLSWLLEKLFPSARVDEVFLNRWWSFIERARLEPPLRFRIAQRFARQITGAWSPETPVDLLNDASDVVVVRVPKSNSGETELRVRAPDFEALWAAHLVRFDLSDDLAKFLAPRFASSIETVRGRTAIAADSPRLPWTLWLDSPPAMETFARGLRTQQGSGGGPFRSVRRPQALGSFLGHLRSRLGHLLSPARAGTALTGDLALVLGAAGAARGKPRGSRAGGPPQHHRRDIPFARPVPEPCGDGLAGGAGRVRGAAARPEHSQRHSRRRSEIHLADVQAADQPLRRNHRDRRRPHRGPGHRHPAFPRSALGRAAGPRLVRASGLRALPCATIPPPSMCPRNGPRREMKPREPFSPRVSPWPSRVRPKPWPGWNAWACAPPTPNCFVSVCGFWSTQEGSPTRAQPSSAASPPIRRR